MLKRVSLPRQVRTTLEGEAILGDPIGAVLAVAVFDLVLGFAGVRSIGILSGAWAYLGRLIIGLCTGVAGAFALSRLLKLPRIVPAELANLVALAFVWLVFAVAETIQSESGIMAAVAMGLALQRGSVPDERRLRQFKEQLTVLGISIVFVLLAADLPLAVLRAEGWRGLLTVMALMLIVRPVNVLTSLRRSKLTLREKAFIAWIAPRGIVAASVASIFALTLQEAGIAEGSRLLAITFLTIALTVAIQGLTAARMARFLGLSSLMGRRVIIVGVGPLGRGLAAILRDHGRPVVLIDRNGAQVEHARTLGFDAVEGNALDESVLELAGGDEAETLVAVTSNPEVNTLAALLAHETFGVRRAFPALAHPSRGAGAQLADRVGGRMAFARPLDVRAWEYEIEYGDARFFEQPVPPQWVGQPAGDIDLPHNVVAVAQLHDSSIEVVHPQLVWRGGDVAILLSTLPAEDVSPLLEKATRDAHSAARPGDTMMAP
jgi:Trk K+ transport system NAD-binding subunit